MIFAIGIFIMSILFFTITLIMRNEFTEQELGINIIAWFVIALASAQYIWG